MPEITPTPPVDDLRDAKIMLIGEAPGQQEEALGKPFVGKSGQELTKMLAEAGIIREECYLTNVFLDRPPSNNIFAWCLKKKEADEAWQALGNEGKYPYVYLKSGNYLDPARLVEALPRLQEEIKAYNPNIIIALGNTPLWALTNLSGITKYRGTILLCDIFDQQYKVLPAFHPAYILRQWESRPVAVADFMKAKKESQYKEFRRINRELWLEPNTQDIVDFREKHLTTAESFAYDIETGFGQITCIGFGTTTHAMCVPFLDTRKPDWSYWQTKDEEVAAWNLVRSILNLSGPLKIAQNGMYDITWLWTKVGIPVNAPMGDTMLMHHSMFPEMNKGLAFLGSIYTNEVSWKTLRPKSMTTKREDT